MDYMAHYEKSPRMWSQGLHAHDYYEIYVHLEGARLYCVDDVIYELKPNQLLVIPPLHMHGLICDRDLVDYERCYLYITPEMLQRCGFGMVDLIKTIDKAYEKQKILCDLSEETAKQIKEKLIVIDRYSQDCLIEKAHRLEIFSHILSILQIMSEALQAKDHPVPQSTSDNSILEILHYINDHFSQDISVESISRQFHISASSLAHKFREYVNKGIYEYILYKRIIRAKELMSTDSSLTDIAFQCGFGDYSNFLRVFKKNTGLSPKEYRNQINYLPPAD